jgi:signal transduction histidine kinase
MVGRLRAYIALVAAIGFALLCLLAANVDLDRLRASQPEAAMLALVVLAAPSLSIPLGRDGRGPSVHVGAPFAFALVPPGPWSGSRWPGGQDSGSSALPAILTGTAVFVAVKSGLVAGAVALDETVRSAIGPARVVRQSVLVMMMAQVGVLVLVLAAERPAVALLALGPMLAAYLLLRSETRAVLARDDAERTARREAELRAQEQEVARRLKETDQMKDDLLAMVSHELRTPLTTVVGALRLLNAGPPMGQDERREMLEMADRQARRLRVLIEQLLVAAQSDNGRAAFLSSAAERVEVDAADLLQEAAGEARAEVCGDRVRVRCDRSLPVRMAPDAVLHRPAAGPVPGWRPAGHRRPGRQRGPLRAAPAPAGPGSAPAGRSRPRPPLGLDALA